MFERMKGSSLLKMKWLHQKPKQIVLDSYNSVIDEPQATTSRRSPESLKSLVVVDKFSDKNEVVYKKELPEKMKELEGFLILCKWPDCYSLQDQEHLDDHQIDCEHRILPCRWMNCNVVVPSKDLFEHETGCVRRDPRNYSCYFNGCMWRGGNMNLMVHLHRDHGDHLVMEPEFDGTAERGSGWSTWYVYHFDELFRVGFGYYEQGDVFYQVAFVGPRTLGVTFDYDFEIKNRETGDTLLRTGTTTYGQPSILRSETVKSYDVKNSVGYRFRIYMKSVNEKKL